MIGPRAQVCAEWHSAATNLFLALVAADREAYAEDLDDLLEEPADDSL
jgi:hypothetical protein